MAKIDDENNNLFDEVDDDEEEIKEDIVIENDDGPENDNNKQNEQIQNTYDKFLIDSVAINRFENKNEYHYMLKNQMANIIDDIKKKKNEEQINKNNIKKMIFQNMENIFFNKNSEDNKVNNEYNFNKIAQKTEKNININQYTLNPQQIQKENNKIENFNNYNSNDYLENLRDLDESNDKTEKINSQENIDISNNVEIGEKEEKDKSININNIKNRGYLNNQNEEVDSKEYNINIDDFLKENNSNEEDIVNNDTNLNIDNSKNYINNQNENFHLEKKNQEQNKIIKYAVKGNPEMEKK